MSDETKTDAAETDVAAGAHQAERTPERRDEEGLPLDRKPTLDDVRGGGGSGRTTAVSCSVAVLLVVLLFWVLRALVMR